MAWVIVLAIIALPLAEVAIFVEVAQEIGVLATIGAAILAGVLGLALWRYQGLQTLARARQAIERGEAPVEQILRGVWLLPVGALLLLPGFLSDVLALVLLLPPVRAGLAALLARRVVVAGARAGARRPHPDRPRVIDVDYHEVEDDLDPLDPPRRP